MASLTDLNEYGAMNKLGKRESVLDMYVGARWADRQ